MTKMVDLPGSLGFARPRTENTLSRRRAATIDLIATFSLTVCLVIAVTAVSLGNRSLARMDTRDRSSVQMPIGALLDQTDGWLSLRAQQ
jgi:hypothetical protein